MTPSEAISPCVACLSQADKLAIIAKAGLAYLENPGGGVGGGGSAQSVLYNYETDIALPIQDLPGFVEENNFEISNNFPGYNAGVAESIKSAYDSGKSIRYVGQMLVGINIASSLYIALGPNQNGSAWIHAGAASSVGNFTTNPPAVIASFDFEIKNGVFYNRTTSARLNQQLASGDVVLQIEIFRDSSVEFDGKLYFWYQQGDISGDVSVFQNVQLQYLTISSIG